MIEYTRYEQTSSRSSPPASCLRLRILRLVYTWYYTWAPSYDMEIMRVTFFGWFEFVIEYVRDRKRRREVEFMVRIGQRFFTKIKLGFSFSKTEFTHQLNLFAPEKKSDF